MSDLSKYFDHNATTPMSEEALRVWNETNSSLWQNTSGLYLESGEAKTRLEECREELADELGINVPERLVFTCGATEANNAVVRFLIEESAKPVAVSAIEHPCVEAAASPWIESGRVREIPVDSRTGIIEWEILSSWVKRGEVSAVSVMAANNETGTLQPWLELARLCGDHEIRFHTDAAQWIGKLPSAEFGECDFVTGSGHKFRGSKGSGFLILPDDEMGNAFHGFVGGPQEEGRRAGTENLPAIASMVSALVELNQDLSVDTMEDCSNNRDEFEAALMRSFGVELVGANAPRLWNTSMFVLPYEKNVKWLSRLSREGFAVSTGSACSAGKGNPSKVMVAMGLDFEAMGRVVRVSGGWDTTREHWQELAEAFERVSEDLAPQ